jgi:hypothetical protein
LKFTIEAPNISKYFSCGTDNNVIDLESEEELNVLLDKEN